VNNTQNHWLFGLCPLFGIPEINKHNVSGTGSVSILRWGGGAEEKTPTQLSPIESANLNPVSEVGYLTIQGLRLDLSKGPN
jgi:hypothetical protein